MDMTADAVVVGGGIAGSAMATMLARNGLQVVVLERQKVYRDRVRGESIPAWGVAEAQRLGLYETLLEAGAVLTHWRVPYDETRSPAAAEAAARDLSQVVLGGLVSDIPRPATRSRGLPKAKCASRQAMIHAFITKWTARNTTSGVL